MKEKIQKVLSVIILMALMLVVIPAQVGLAQNSNLGNGLVVNSAPIIKPTPMPTENQLRIRERQASLITTPQRSLILKSFSTMATLSVSGTINLPSGEVAPSGGLLVRVYLNSYNNVYSQSTSVTIPAGSSSASYSVSALENTGYYLSYEIQTAGSKYLNGYYSKTTLSTSYSDKTNICVLNTSKTGVNITLIKGVIVSGTVSLPNGEVAPTGGLNVSVNLEQLDGDDYQYKLFTIPANSNSVNYSVAVFQGKSYRTSYRLETNGTRYINAFYSTSGVTTKYDSATKLDTNTDLTAINLTMAKGVLISGTISLPNGEVAPSSGMYVSLYATESNNIEQYFDVQMPANTNSINYSIAVNQNSNCNIYVSTYSSSGTKYLTSYYSSNGMTTDWKSIDEIHVANTDVTGISATLLKGVEISGIISLPNGEVAGEDGLLVSVSSTGGSFYQGGDVFILTNSTSATYSVIAEKNSVTSIKYEIQTEDTGYADGYYSTTSDETTDINVGNSDLTDKNITISKGVLLSANISLPNNELAPTGGINIECYLQDTNDNNSAWKQLTIPAGSNSITFSKMVSKNTSYYLEYYIRTSGTKYLDAYYCTEGTNVNYDSRTIINVGNTDISISMPILSGVLVSGMLSLPNNEVAPTGGLAVRMQLSQANGGSSQITTVIIPSGSNSVNYSVIGAESTEYYMQYYLETDSLKYFNSAFYSTTGATTNYSDKTIINLLSENITGVNMQLLSGVALSGTISLPNNEVAPSGGIEVGLYINNINFSQNKQFAIPSGTNSINYVVVVSPNSTYYIEYGINNNTTNYLNGYYCTTGTTTKYSNKSDINVGNTAVTDINIQMLKGVKLSGTISLPNNEVAPSGGIYADVWVETETDSNGQGIEIPGGSNSVDYSFLVEANTTCYIKYSINTGGTKYLDGYYCSTGTTDDYYSRSIISVGNVDISNLNITCIGDINVNMGLTFTLSDITYTENSNNTITACSKVNAVSIGGTVTYAVALYDNNDKLIQIATSNPTIETGSSQSISNDFVIPEIQTNYKLKFFVWDSLQTLKPLAIYETIDIPLNLQ